MTEYDACEQAFHNGYEQGYAQGYAQGKKDADENKTDDHSCIIVRFGKDATTHKFCSACGEELACGYPLKSCPYCGVRFKEIKLGSPEEAE